MLRCLCASLSAQDIGRTCVCSGSRYQSALVNLSPPWLETLGKLQLLFILIALGDEFLGLTVITNILLNKQLPLLASCSVLRRSGAWEEAGPYPFWFASEARTTYSLFIPQVALINCKPLKKVSWYLLLSHYLLLTLEKVGQGQAI